MTTEAIAVEFLSPAAMAVSKSEEFATLADGMNVQEKVAKFAAGFDEASQQCSLDILPILLEKGSFPFHTSHDPDVSDISGLPDEGETSPDCAFLSFLEVSCPSKSQNFIDIRVKGPNAYSSCIVDIDIEKEKAKAPEPSEGTLEALRSDNVLTNVQKVLRRQTSLKTSGKLVQVLIDHGLTLLKFTSRDKSVPERAHDTPNNRWRRYKRAASFDSRKVVTLFSILSSFGTLVLIYLTLRVRQQSGDGSAPL